MSDAYCHSASILIEDSAERVFPFMADGLLQGRWTLGSWERRELNGENYVCGTSLLDGKATFVRLNVDRQRLRVDYDVGRAPEAMQFRNAARVLPGEAFGYGENRCIVTLLTWRLATQSDDAWQAVSKVHEAEMYLIRGLVETAKRV
ncbi:MAG TPA: hypothetical protein VF265_08465 [Nevskiaceae bacterium]